MENELNLHLNVQVINSNTMKKNIDIKEPCSENWEQMAPTQKGAFCDKCALEVYDFSNKSGDEIRDILKLNLGGLCGRLKPSQLSELNDDFTAWNMNSKRSFQSALVFSLIVAFGMTLFGCEEDEDVQIKEIQAIGLTFMDDGKAVSDSMNPDNLEVNLIKKVSNPIILENFEDVGIYEDQIMGTMVMDVDNEPVQDVETPITLELAEQPMMAGGIGYSSDYANYLEEIPTQFIEVETEIKFQAFAFPNPAKERTTLKIILPEETKVQVKLFDIGGQFIRDISSKKLPKGESNFPIDLIGLRAGTYILSVITSENNESVKFIKR